MTTKPCPTLAEELAAYKEGFRQRVAPDRVAMMEEATANLRATGIEARALKTGDLAPDVTLPDALGNAVSLETLWRAGPVVVLFYRGGWCPYCNLELRAWQREIATLEQYGAKLVAVSPQTPDNSLSTAEKNALAFPVLSDSTLRAAEAFGIAFTLSPELVELYGRAGNDLPAINGNGQWALPVPATFVIDRRGRFAFAHVNSDYRDRAEPAKVIEAVARIRETDLNGPGRAQIFASGAT